MAVQETEQLHSNKVPAVRPAALFDAETRKKIAHLIVWGNPDHISFYAKFEIERRLEALLERIANTIQGQHTGNTINELLETVSAMDGKGDL